MTDNMNITPEIFNKTIALVRKNGIGEEADICEDFLVACFMDTEKVQDIVTLDEAIAYETEVMTNLIDAGYDLDINKITN